MKDSLSTSLSLPLIHCWSLQTWTLDFTVSLATSSGNIENSMPLLFGLFVMQSAYLKQPERFHKARMSIRHTLASMEKKKHLNSHINPFVWNLKSQNMRLNVLCGFLSQHVCHPCYVCRGYYLPHLLFPDPHPKAPPPPVSLRAGWHPVSYSSGSAAPYGELSGTNEWKTPASPQVPLLLSQLFVAAYVQQTKPSKHDGNKAGNGGQLYMTF